MEILDIDDTFCAAHGGQQLAFWNAHHDERGFASMHIYHVASCTPVAAILRPARTPKGTEVCTVIKHVTQRLRKHWPNARIVSRGDSYYGRVEAMEWAENNGSDYIFGLQGNAVLDAMVAETADHLRFRHAKSRQAKVRTYVSFTYQANSWKRPRKVVARLECSLQPDEGGTTSTGMRQEVDIRYVVTSLKGSAQYLYENVYCERGQAENLIKLHKAQLSPDRMSCHSATANQVRLAFHTAAFWLMHAVRAAIPQTDPLATAEFATIRERLIKSTHHRVRCAHPHPVADQLPGGCAVLHRRARHHAVRSVSGGALCPDEPPVKADQPQTRCMVSCWAPTDQMVGAVARACANHVRKCLAWCMIRVRSLAEKAGEPVTP